MAGSHGQFFVGGNWKCNGTVDSVRQLVADLNKAGAPNDVEVVVAPTFLHLHYVHDNLSAPIQVAAQNCWVGKGGAFTGEISAEQLSDFGIPWVILGHSERRALLEESNETVGQKVAYALSQGVKVIACIGETLQQREGGHMFDVLDAQLSAIADNVADWSDVVVAYEPVWAIGTGKVASPQQAQEVHAYLRKWFTDRVGSDVAGGLRIIYGGSVNDANSGDLAQQPDVDGFLVGGASLQAKSFASICKARQQVAA